MKLRKIENFEIMTEKTVSCGTAYEEGCEFIIRIVKNSKIVHLISGYHKPYYSIRTGAMITKYCYRDYTQAPVGEYTTNLSFLKEFLA